MSTILDEWRRDRKPYWVQDVPEIMLQTRSKKLNSEQSRRMLELLDRYGSLLTPRQFSFSVLHYRDGRTLADIARDQNVSRQAIHDAVTHARRTMEEYETKLSLCNGKNGASINNSDALEISGRLKGLQQKIARQGIIYSVDWILAELREVTAMVETHLPGNDHTTPEEHR